MRIKKTISIMVLIALLCTSLFSVFGEELSPERIMLMQAAGEPIGTSSEEQATTKISRENAITIAKTMLEDATLYDINNVNLLPYTNDSKKWEVTFSKKQFPYNDSINVSIDSQSGEIISFYVSQSFNGQQNFIATLTKEEAKTKADEYLQKTLKQNISSYEVQPGYSRDYYSNDVLKQPVTYNFFYINKVNGVLFPNNSINISVDGTSGKVMSFYKNVPIVSPTEFPSPNAVVSSDDVYSMYQKSCLLNLQYISMNPNKFSRNTSTVIKLVYTPTTDISMVDATNSKAIDYFGNAINIDIKALKDRLFTPIAMKKDAKLESKAISESQASIMANSRKTFVENHLKIKFDTDRNSFSMTASHQNGTNKVWNYNWNKREGNSNTYFNININQETGHIESMNYHSYLNALSNSTQVKKTEVKENFTWLKSKDKAIAIIKEILPEQYGFFVDENTAKPQLSSDELKYKKDYSFYFTRLVNNIRYRDNSIYISIDRTTGKLSLFNTNWSDIDFPDAKAVIETEVAAKAYFANTLPKLSYTLLQTANDLGNATYSNKPKLIYTFSPKQSTTPYGTSYIDAITGKIIDFTGNEITDNLSPNTEVINNHWAKRSIQLLTAQGIWDFGNKDYNAGITRYDAIKILSLAKGINFRETTSSDTDKTIFSDVSKTNEYYSFVDNALAQKIIFATSSELKGNEIITKGEFTKLLINLMGYTEIAKYKDIFKATDAINTPADMLGYVSLCKAMDILPTAPQSIFDVSQQLTYGEAANALYRALKYVR